MKNLKIELVRPPVAVRVSAAAVRERALACAFVSLRVHIVSNRGVLSDCRFAPESGTLVAEHEAEMTLVVDPTLSVRDVWPTTSGATLKTTLPHWSAYMWKQCRTQAGRDLIIIHMPNINTITEP